MRFDKGVDWIYTDEATVLACCFAGLSIIISTIHICQHLLHYAMPGIQIYVIRILIICPVYALSSALALILAPNGTYAETARDVYEAFVIYSFLNLILEYCGGETDCVYQIENEPPLRLPMPFCCVQKMPRDARLMRFCQRGVLQFIIIKPLFALIDIVMLSTDYYYNMPYQIFEMVVYNISYAIALYTLYVFYLATSEIIAKFRPIIKFVAVKAIVFATYYQSLAVKSGPMSPETAYMWNDFILCIEMVIFALLLTVAFPTSEFQGGIPDSKFLSNVKDVLSVRDVVQDVYHNFTPVYHDYALQRSEKETVKLKTYLAGNLDSVAIEMSHRYRGRNKRLAFNSLLRGSTPISAKLRNNRNVFDGSMTRNGDSYNTLSDEGNSVHSNSSSENLNLDDSIHFDKRGSGDCTIDRIDSSERGLLSSAESTPRTSPETYISKLTAEEKKFHQNRLKTMKTNGIGLVISKSGIGVTLPDEFPTEEGNLANSDFMQIDKQKQHVLLLDQNAKATLATNNNTHQLTLRKPAQSKPTTMVKPSTSNRQTQESTSNPLQEKLPVPTADSKVSRIPSKTYPPIVPILQPPKSSSDKYDKEMKTEMHNSNVSEKSIDAVESGENLNDDADTSSLWGDFVQHDDNISIDEDVSYSDAIASTVIEVQDISVNVSSKVDDDACSALGSDDGEVTDIANPKDIDVVPLDNDNNDMLKAVEGEGDMQSGDVIVISKYEILCEDGNNKVIDVNVLHSSSSEQSLYSLEDDKCTNTDDLTANQDGMGLANETTSIIENEKTHNDIVDINSN